MNKIEFALKLAKDCTYADEMTEGAKDHLRNEINEALKILCENGKLSHISDALNDLKIHLEVNAGRLCEPIIKQGKNPKDDTECHKAFLVLAHLEAIEDYLITHQPL